MKLLSFFTLLFFIGACSSTYTEKVVHRMDDVDNKPSWASMQRVMYEKDGRIFVVGISTGSSTARVAGLAKISDNNARFEISRFIQNEMGFIFQNVEEGVEPGAELSHFFGTEISKTISHQIRSESRYYEKIQIKEPSGDLRIRTDMYSLISVKENVLKKLIRKTIEKNNQLSAEVKQKVTEHLNKKIDTL